MNIPFIMIGPILLQRLEARWGGVATVSANQRISRVITAFSFFFSLTQQCPWKIFHLSTGIIRIGETRDDKDESWRRK
jgi:hypothetical protein